MSKYSLGLDFGTESGRALLVDVSDGREVASAVFPYPAGVIDEKLPGTDIRIDPDWALQNPNDYLAVLRTAVPQVLKQAGVNADDIIGIGVDFTACTVLPVTQDGTPLCNLPEWKNNPHAWVKLWKHHAAQPEADRINALARERGEWWLPYYGGKISSEWLLSKTLQMLDEAPEVFDAAHKIVEAGDWLVFQMTGVETRNACAAGYKGLYQGAYPSNDFLVALDPRLNHFNETKIAGKVLPPGVFAGALTEQAAPWMGLNAGTAVAVATIDAHAAVPGCGVTEGGRMVLILGTSTCHMVMDAEKQLVPGISGVVQDGILPGLFGYEGGQAGVGDIFEWFVENGVPREYHAQAEQRGMSVYALLEQAAAKLQVGESGLLALDWWNGNRSVLTDANLSGLLIGMTLGTRTPDIFRALIEATAFGTQIIVETFEQNGVVVNELVACGGLAARNKLLLQIYADVTGRAFKVAESAQTSALGAALFGAVAAGSKSGGFDDIHAAAKKMARLQDIVYTPNAKNHATYQKLVAEYKLLHDYFGRGENDVMKRLREMKHAVLP
ncbi:MAG: ribulokinase [Chloroflexi bacterium]|nr:ribulokinase [Chloroflexota bacterium]